LQGCSPSIGHLGCCVEWIGRYRPYMRVHELLWHRPLLPKATEVSRKRQNNGHYADQVSKRRSPIGVIRKLICEFLLVNNTNIYTLHRFQGIADWLNFCF